jgi:hypothetical protein
MIVIEGMDNSGKSTLAAGMADYMDLLIQESEGPPRTTDNMSPEEEINDRVDRYAMMTGRLFVRHPVISNSIYGQVRPEGDPISPGRRMIFYESKPILIYCDAGSRGLLGHDVKEHDTQRHLDDIAKNYGRILDLYRQWAAQYAHFVYRIGDDMDQLIATVHYYEAYNQA